MDKKLDEYFKLVDEIHEYFNYTEQWSVFPLTDAREEYWKIIDGEEVYYGKKEDIENDNGKYYSAEIYKYRHLENHIFRTDKYTMVLLDTQCDGNKLLFIFDNNKELK